DTRTEIVFLQHARVALTFGCLLHSPSFRGGQRGFRRLQSRPPSRPVDKKTKMPLTRPDLEVVLQAARQSRSETDVATLEETRLVASLLATGTTPAKERGQPSEPSPRRRAVAPRRGACDAGESQTRGPQAAFDR